MRQAFVNFGPGCITVPSGTGISATNCEFKQVGPALLGATGTSGVKLGIGAAVPAMGATTGVSVAGSPEAPITVAVGRRVAPWVAPPAAVAARVGVAGAVVGVF